MKQTLMATTCLLAFAFPPPASAHHPQKEPHAKLHARHAAASKHIVFDRSISRRHRVAAIGPRHARGKRPGHEHIASLRHRHAASSSRHGRFVAGRNRTIREARGIESSGSVGVASYYGARGLTAAHRSLPFGTRVRVTNLSNGSSVIVRINDRGPFVRGRAIDLSTSAARAIGMTGAGVAHVYMQVI
jgi:rare lipoprotein A